MGEPKSDRCGSFTSAGWKRQHGGKDMPSNWRRFDAANVKVARVVASPGFHSARRFDLARQAGLQKLGRDLLRRRRLSGSSAR